MSILYYYYNYGVKILIDVLSIGEKFDMEKLLAQKEVLGHYTRGIRLSCPQSVEYLPELRTFHDWRVSDESVFQELTVVYLHLLPHTGSRLLYHSGSFHKLPSAKRKRSKCWEHPQNYECQQICLRDGIHVNPTAGSTDTYFYHRTRIVCGTETDSIDWGW